MKTPMHKIKTLFVSPEVSIFENYTKMIDSDNIVTIEIGALYNQYQQDLADGKTSAKTFEEYKDTIIYAMKEIGLSDTEEPEVTDNLSFELATPIISLNDIIVDGVNLSMFTIHELYMYDKQNGNTDTDSYSKYFSDKIDKLFFKGLSATTPSEEAFYEKYKNNYLYIKPLAGCVLEGSNADVSINTDKNINPSHEQQEKNVKAACEVGINGFGALCTTTDLTKVHAPNISVDRDPTECLSSLTEFVKLEDFVDSRIQKDAFSMENIIQFLYKEVLIKLPAIINCRIAIINNSDSLKPFKESKFISDKLTLNEKVICSHIKNNLLDARKRPFIIYFKAKETNPTQSFRIINDISISGIFSLCTSVISHDINNYKNLYPKIDMEELKTNFNIATQGIKLMNNNYNLYQNPEVYSNWGGIEELTNQYNQLINSAEILKQKNALKDYFKLLYINPLITTFSPRSFINTKTFTAYNLNGFMFVFDYYDNHVRVYAPEDENLNSEYTLSDLYVDIPFDKNMFTNIHIFIKSVYCIKYNEFYNNVTED